jgi:hypothetical protein
LNQWTAIVAFTLAVAYLALRGVRERDDNLDVSAGNVDTDSCN